MNYGSAVWGFAQYSKPQILQNRLSRFYLGVHRFAPVASTKIEMNWLDTRETRWIEMIRYHNVIVSMEKDRLPRMVYEWDKSLNIQAWTSEIEYIFDKIGFDVSKMGISKVDLEHASKELLTINQSTWRRESELKPKLRTFNQIHDFNELQILVTAPVTRMQRSLLAQFKSGILPLKIETDRYQGIKLENRLCKICNLSEPEDEFHFIFRCPALSHARLSMRSGLDISHISLTSDMHTEKLKSLLRSENISSFAIYLECLYKSRQKLIYG